MTRSFLSFMPRSILQEVMLVPTSMDTSLILRNLGLTSNLREPGDATIDLTIDGADRITRDGYAIKGGGGALTREKIVRYHSREFWIMVDETKLVDDLTSASFPIPVEILPFGFQATLSLLEEMFAAKVVLRVLNEKKLGPIVTDNGNYIADVFIEKAKTPVSVVDLEKKMKSLPGVVECGLFTTPPCDRVFMAKKDGTVYSWNPSKGNVNS